MVKWEDGRGWRKGKRQAYHRWLDGGRNTCKCKVDATAG